MRGNSKKLEAVALDDISRNKAPRKKRKYQWEAILWLIVPIVMFAIFCYYPPIKAIFDSFFDTRIISGKATTYFNGFENYKNILSDQMFWICFKNVLIFMVIGFICGHGMNILLAELMFNYHSKKLNGAFRVLFILPILVPGLVLMLVWKYVIFGDNGLMNQLGLTFGVEHPLWYWDSENGFIAKFAIIMTNFPWVGGTTFLIYLAGFQNISKSVMEASKLDNCSVWKRIRKIDLPLIRPQLKYFLVMSVIGGFQNFDLQLVIIGAEYPTSATLGLYLYDRAFGIGYSDPTRGVITERFGYASAVGVIILIITLILSIINMSTNKEKTDAVKKKKNLSYKKYLKEVKKNEKCISK